MVGEKEGEDGAQINVVMMSVQISSGVGEGPGGGVEEGEGWWERISSMRCERTCFAPRMRSVSRSWRWVYGGMVMYEVVLVLQATSARIVAFNAATNPPPGATDQDSKSTRKAASCRCRCTWCLRGSHERCCFSVSRREGKPAGWECWRWV